MGAGVRLSDPAPTVGLGEGAGEPLEARVTVPLADAVYALLDATALRLVVPPNLEAVAHDPVGDAEGHPETDSERVPLTEALGQRHAVAEREGLAELEGLLEGSGVVVALSHPEGV